MAAYLKLTGKSQGEIDGSVISYGRENSIEVMDWRHEITSPRDVASGMGTGRRQHNPFVIVKEVDKATPKLLKAMLTNELLPTWSLECWRSAIDGNEEPFYRIELTNALISAMTAQGLTEEISFVYQKIVWTWLDGGITAEDSWAGRGA